MRLVTIIFCFEGESMAMTKMVDTPYTTNSKMDDRKLTVCYGRGNYKQAPPQIFYRVSGWNRSDSPQRIKLL